MDYSPQIEDIQTKLKMVGFNPGPIDGLKGPKTDDAIIAFKAKRGISNPGDHAMITKDFIRELQLDVLASATDDYKDNNSNIDQDRIKELKDKVEPIKDILPDYKPSSKDIIDTSIKDVVSDPEINDNILSLSNKISSRLENLGVIDTLKKGLAAGSAKIEHRPQTLPYIKKGLAAGSAKIEDRPQTLPYIKKGLAIAGKGIGKGFDKLAENYEYPIVPLLAVIESIATSGASPGTSAMKQQQVLEATKTRKQEREINEMKRKLVESEYDNNIKFRDAYDDLYRQRSKDLITDDEFNASVKKLVVQYFPEKAFSLFKEPKVSYGQEQQELFNKELSEYKQNYKPDIDSILKNFEIPMSSIQKYLKDAGYTDYENKPLIIDGTYGKRTRIAIKKFQKEEGLPVTGKTDNGLKTKIIENSPKLLKKLEPSLKGLSPEDFETGEHNTFLKNLNVKYPKATVPYALRAYIGESETDKLLRALNRSDAMSKQSTARKEGKALTEDQEYNQLINKFNKQIGNTKLDVLMNVGKALGFTDDEMRVIQGKRNKIPRGRELEVIKYLTESKNEMNNISITKGSDFYSSHSNNRDRFAKYYNKKFDDIINSIK